MPSLFAGHPYPTAVDVFVATKTRCSLTGIFNIGIIPHTQCLCKCGAASVQDDGVSGYRALEIHVFLSLQGRFCYIFNAWDILFCSNRMTCDTVHPLALNSVILMFLSVSLQHFTLIFLLVKFIK